MKKCPKCSVKKQLNDFGNNKNTKDGKQRYCKACQAEFDHKHYLKDPAKHKLKASNKAKQAREWVNNYKKECECEKCGDKRWYVLQFHHIDPSKKEFNISDTRKSSIKSLSDEIKKCKILCSNCHLEFHYMEREHNITIKQYIE